MYVWVYACVGCAGLPLPAGHNRDPRNGRAQRGGQADGRARPKDTALPLAALPGRRDLHRVRRKVRYPRGHHQGLQAHHPGGARPPARTGLLHGGQHRRRGRQGRTAR